MGLYVCSQELSVAYRFCVLQLPVDLQLWKILLTFETQPFRNKFFDFFVTNYLWFSADLLLRNTFEAGSVLYGIT